MASYLLGLLADIVQQPDGEEPVSDGIRLHGRMFLAAFSACTILGFLELATNPTALAPSASRPFSLSVAIAALALGGVLLLLLKDRLAENGAAPVVVMAGATQVLASVSLAIGIAFAPSSEIALVVAVATLGVATPFILFFWSSLFSAYSKADILINSAAGFLVFDIFFTIARLLPDSLPSLTAGSAAMSGMALIVLRKFCRDGQTGDVEGKLPERELGEEASGSEPLRSLLLSIPFFGVLLFMFTTGIVTRGSDSIANVAVSAAGSLAVVVASGIFFLRNRGARTVNQRLYLLFDLGLPGLAVAAFVIKMIPLDLLSDTAFPGFMEMYFMVLLMAFWTKLMGWGSVGRPLLPTACAAITLGSAAALGLGTLSTLTRPDTTSIILGLVTASYLLLAVVAVGQGLILYAKGSEAESELTPAPLDIADVCRTVSQEHQLTPRETEVLEELAYGHSSSYIAKVFVISSNTARTHMKNIYKKLDVNSREELIELLRKKQSASRENPLER